MQLPKLNQEAFLRFFKKECGITRTMIDDMTPKQYRLMREVAYKAWREAAARQRYITNMTELDEGLSYNQNQSK